MLCGVTGAAGRRRTARLDFLSPYETGSPRGRSEDA
jgi:hypothetical protein